MVLRLFILVLTLSGCAVRPENPLTRGGFDSNSWKCDSLGCKNYRQSKIELLVSNKQWILLQEKRKIISLFGKPNVSRSNGYGDSIYIYITEPSIFCLDTSVSSNISEAVTNMYLIVAAKGSVIDMGTTVP